MCTSCSTNYALLLPDPPLEAYFLLSLKQPEKFNIRWCHISWHMYVSNRTSGSMYLLLHVTKCSGLKALLLSCANRLIFLLSLTHVNPSHFQMVSNTIMTILICLFLPHGEQVWNLQERLAEWNLNCPFFLTLVLQKLQAQTATPWSAFEHQPRCLCAKGRTPQEARAALHTTRSWGPSVSSAK